MRMGFAWDYTSWLNLAFLVPAAVLVWRFLSTGGPKMLQMMESASPHEEHNSLAHGSGSSAPHH